MKNADLKIWSFLAKKHGLTLWKKVELCSKYKYSFKNSQWNQCVQKCPLRNFLGLPRNQRERNPPPPPPFQKERKKENQVRVGVKQKILLQGVICTHKRFSREFCNTLRSLGRKQVKNADLKIWSFWPKSMD